MEKTAPVEPVTQEKVTRSPDGGPGPMQNDQPKNPLAMSAPGGGDADDDDKS